VDGCHVLPGSLADFPGGGPGKAFFRKDAGGLLQQALASALAAAEGRSSILITTKIKRLINFHDGMVTE
jgi:hypothetical protein